MNVRRRRGFTLVEVLVGLAVFSLIMLATVSGLRTLGNTQVSVDRRTDRLQELRAVSSFLRDAFGGAVTGNDTGGLTLGGGLQERTVFLITDDGDVIWRSVVLFGETFGGNYLLRLGLEKDVLTLRWREHDGRAPDRGWNKASSRSLINDVDRFAVAYRREPAGAWRTRWDAAGVPGWVRLRVRSGGRYLPDLVMVVAQ